MPLLSTEQIDARAYVDRAASRAVAGSSGGFARHGGRFLGSQTWEDEQGHWLRVRGEMPEMPDVEVQYARIILPASGPDTDPETEAIIFSSGFEERLHTRFHGVEPVGGVIAL